MAPPHITATKTTKTSTEKLTPEVENSTQKKDSVLTPTDLLSSIYITQDSEGIILACFRLFQVKGVKVELKQNS